MFGVGALEIALVCGILILFFGPKLFVKWAKGFGETLKVVKTAKKEIEEVQNE